MENIATVLPASTTKLPRQPSEMIAARARCGSDADPMLRPCSERKTCSDDALERLGTRTKEFAESLGITFMPFEPPEPDISGFLMRSGIPS
jgi:hypothetical protein